MCVRDLNRGKCKAWRRTTSKANSCQSDKVSSSSSKTSTIRRARRMKQREEVDLLCTELLSQNDSKSYHADSSHLELEYEPLSPLMTDIPSTSCAANDPFVYALLLSPASPYFNYKERRLWSGVEHVSWPMFGYGDKFSVGVAVHDHHAKNDPNWSDEGLIDGVDWHDFSPDQHCGLQMSKQESWQCAEGETFPQSGSSLQSNSLPCEKRHVQARRPSCNGRKRMPIERMTNSRSRKKLEFSASAEISYSIASDSVNDHERVNSYYHEGIFFAKGSACQLEFRETMEFLLEKESTTNYQLSNAYFEKLTGHSNALRGARRNLVNWIVKVVDLLLLSSITAAHAVSLFDRNLSQRLIMDAQDDHEENEELLLAATACVWIAAKMEDSSSPHLSSMRALAGVEHEDVKIRKMEVLVLKSLGWRVLGVTAADFLVNMIAQLPALGLPSDLLTPLGYRSEEIMRQLLPEVEFLAYQPSVVCFSVMQCLLDELCVPVQTVALMAGLHLALAVDLESKEKCYRTLTDLVALVDIDATQVSLLQFPNRGCVNFKYNYLHSDPSIQNENMRLSIPAF